MRAYRTAHLELRRQSPHPRLRGGPAAGRGGRVCRRCHRVRVKTHVDFTQPLAQLGECAKPIPFKTAVRESLVSSSEETVWSGASLTHLQDLHEMTTAGTRLHTRQVTLQFFEDVAPGIDGVPGKSTAFDLAIHQVALKRPIETRGAPSDVAADIFECLTPQLADGCGPLRKLQAACARLDPFEVVVLDLERSHRAPASLQLHFRSKADIAGKTFYGVQWILELQGWFLRVASRQGNHQRGAADLEQLRQLRAGIVTDQNVEPVIGA